MHVTNSEEPRRPMPLRWIKARKRARQLLRDVSGVAVIELATHHLLARVRTSVDVRDLGIPSAMSDAEEVHACQAAVALLGR